MKILLAFFILTALIALSQSKKHLEIKYDLEDEFLPGHKETLKPSKHSTHHEGKHKALPHKSKLSYFQKDHHHQRKDKPAPRTASHHGTRLQYHLTKKDAWAHHDNWARKDLHLQDLTHHQPDHRKSHRSDFPSHKSGQDHQHSGDSSTRNHHKEPVVTRSTRGEVHSSKHESERKPRISITRNVHPLLRSLMNDEGRHHFPTPHHEEKAKPTHTKHHPAKHNEEHTTEKSKHSHELYDKNGKKAKKAFSKKHGKKHAIKAGKTFSKFKW